MTPKQVFKKLGLICHSTFRDMRTIMPGSVWESRLSFSACYRMYLEQSTRHIYSEPTTNSLPDIQAALIRTEDTREPRRVSLDGRAFIYISSTDYLHFLQQILGSTQSSCIQAKLLPVEAARLASPSASLLLPLLWRRGSHAPGGHLSVCPLPKLSCLSSFYDFILSCDSKHLF